MVYQGYEWQCPDCESWNQDDCIPNDNQVQCGKCNGIYIGAPHNSPEIKADQ
jgi:hypothetical protein